MISDTKTACLPTFLLSARTYLLNFTAQKALGKGRKRGYTIYSAHTVTFSRRPFRA